MAIKHKGSYGAFEIQCKICKFRNKVSPPNKPNYEYKPSSIPCLGKGHPSNFTCLGCNQKILAPWLDFLHNLHISKHALFTY